MTTQIIVEDLSPITLNSTTVLTTELLAQLYGTQRQRITNNYNRNKDRFIEGKHYFMARGCDLENLKNSLRGFQNQIADNVRKLILWTERGAARHAKMLETDQAWEVFEKLEDCYFRRGTGPERSHLPTDSNYDSRVLIYLRHGLPVAALPLTPGQLVVTPDSIIKMLIASGYIVTKKDNLLSYINSL